MNLVLVSHAGSLMTKMQNIEIKTVREIMMVIYCRLILVLIICQVVKCDVKKFCTFIKCVYLCAFIWLCSEWYVYCAWKNLQLLVNKGNI